MAEIRETVLPGVGSLHEFESESGRRIGVITRHGDRRELVIYDESDADRVCESVTLHADEANVLADLLGGSVVVTRLEDLRQQISGLAIDWLTVSPHSSFVGQTLGETELRKETGISIVAIVRGDEQIAAPGPDQDLRAGDSVVVVGTSDAIDAATEILSMRTP